MKVKTVILEDNIIARITLEHYCDNYPGIEVVNSFDTVKDALEYLSGNAVNLIFLDIELKDGLGWKVIDAIGPQTNVIVTTSFEEYSRTAMLNPKVKHTLMKPIYLESFLKLMKLIEKDAV